MPHRPPKRCTRCTQLATHQGRCDEHQRTAWENPSANSQALSGWQRTRLRDEQLAREPQCRRCQATTHLEADHIIEIADGGHPTDPANLQTLCTDCHADKSAEAKAARAARQRRTRTAAT